MWADGCLSTPSSQFRWAPDSSFPHRSGGADRWIRGKGQPGVVLLLALGTGIGSALFVNGQLVPNMQLGHVEFHGRDAETRLSAAARTRRNIGRRKWGREFNELLARYEVCLWPDLIILGGGMAKEFSKYKQFLRTNAPLVAAVMGNTAGIIGAARVGENAARASDATQGLVRPRDPGQVLDRQGTSR